MKCTESLPEGTSVREADALAAVADIVRVQVVEPALLSTNVRAVPCQSFPLMKSQLRELVEDQGPATPQLNPRLGVEVVRYGDGLPRWVALSPLRFEALQPSSRRGQGLCVVRDDFVDDQPVGACPGGMTDPILAQRKGVVDVQ